MQLTYSTDGPVAITLRFARYDFTERRNTWEWTLHDKSGHATDADVVIASAEDLRDASGEDASAVEMLRAFLSFLSAWAEGVQYGERSGGTHKSENADLFPTEAMDRVMSAGEWGEWVDRVTLELFTEAENVVHVPAADHFVNVGAQRGDVGKGDLTINRGEVTNITIHEPGKHPGSYIRDDLTAVEITTPLGPRWLGAERVWSEGGRVHWERNA